MKIGAARSARKRLALKAPPMTERPEMRSAVKLLNSAMVAGGAVHVANEGLLSWLPTQEARENYLKAMAADGCLPGFPDVPLLWAMPDRWRVILEAAGEHVPEHVALTGMLEFKRPGWTASGDKRWRDGKQPKAHAWLRERGVPVAVVRDVAEAFEAAKAMGVPLRFAVPASGKHPANSKPALVGVEQPGP